MTAAEVIQHVAGYIDGMSLGDQGVTLEVTDFEAPADTLAVAVLSTDDEPLAVFTLTLTADPDFKAGETA